MKQDRKKWDQKHAHESRSQTPSNLIKNFIQMAPKGRALVIAAGNGRNALYLAQKGFAVDAVDISTVALRKFSGRFPSINPICADLDNYTIRPGRYSLITNIRYLGRHLFGQMEAGLIAGGLIIFRTFMQVDTPQRGAGPSNTAHLLKENELRHAFPNLTLHLYREEKQETSRGTIKMASLVAQKKP